VAGTCEYGNELSVSINAGNFLTSCKSFSRRTLLHGVSKYYMNRKDSLPGTTERTNCPLATPVHLNITLPTPRSSHGAIQHITFLNFTTFKPHLLYLDYLDNEDGTRKLIRNICLYLPSNRPSYVRSYHLGRIKRSEKCREEPSFVT
jgi:hypothetical protein